MSKDAISWVQQGQPGLALFTLVVHLPSQGPVDVSAPFLGTYYSQTSSFSGPPRPFCGFFSTLETCLSLQIPVQPSDPFHHPLRSRNHLPCPGSQTMVNLKQALPVLEFLSSPGWLRYPRPLSPSRSQSVESIVPQDYAGEPEILLTLPKTQKTRLRYGFPSLVSRWGL